MIRDGIHISNICTKANWTLGFLRRNLYACPQEIKEAVHKGLVHPVLEYSASVWDPSGVGLQIELQKVQNRAARFVTGNYNFENGSMTGILILNIKNGNPSRNGGETEDSYCYTKASIQTADLIPLVRRGRNDHSMAYQVPIANTDIYKCSFVPQTISDWNPLQDSLISSAEGAEDGETKSWGLDSLVMVTVLVNDCRSDVSPINNSDSEMACFV